MDTNSKFKAGLPNPCQTLIGFGVITDILNNISNLKQLLFQIPSRPPMIRWNWVEWRVSILYVTVDLYYLGIFFSYFSYFRNEGIDEPGVSRCQVCSGASGCRHGLLGTSRSSHPENCKLWYGGMVRRRKFNFR